MKPNNTEVHEDLIVEKITTTYEEDVSAPGHFNYANIDRNVTRYAIYHADGSITNLSKEEMLKMLNQDNVDIRYTKETNTLDMREKFEATPEQVDNLQERYASKFNAESDRIPELGNNKNDPQFEWHEYRYGDFNLTPESSKPLFLIPNDFTWLSPEDQIEEGVNMNMSLPPVAEQLIEEEEDEEIMNMSTIVPVNQVADPIPRKKAEPLSPELQTFGHLACLWISFFAAFAILAKAFNLLTFRPKLHHMYLCFEDEQLRAVIEKELKQSEIPFVIKDHLKKDHDALCVFGFQQKYMEDNYQEEIAKMGSKRVYCIKPYNVLQTGNVVISPVTTYLLEDIGKTLNLKYVPFEKNGEIQWTAEGRQLFQDQCQNYIKNQ
jgi:CO dehydrogenase/acetyl-CoA synthase epsilon subunit